MSITDELREGGKHAPGSNTRWFGEEELEAIADRIDAERAKAVERARMDGMDATFGDGWVKLPVDADGVPIRVGDVVGWGDDEEFEVMGFGGICMERAFYLNEGGRFCWGIAENCRHVQPDTFEQIIKEAADYGGRRTFSGTSGDKAYLAELVDRCKRLAGEGE